MTFAPSLKELRAELDASLWSFLEERAAELSDARALIDEVARLLRAGGKRLRPCFCYWGFRAAGGAHGNSIVKAAAALELLHTFAIVHDDIMDRAPTRRGVPTVHHLHGIGVALLAGDLALVLADHALMTCGLDERAVTRAFAHYSRMRQEVIAGQYLDIVAAVSASVSEDEARRIAVLKSGRYSVREPLLIGAALAGADEGMVAELAAFGEPLGEAFQLRDDLLGTFGEPGALGKPVDSDIREGKRNLLYAKTLARLEPADAARFKSAWGRGSALSERDVADLRDLVETSGARAEVEALLGDLATTALDRLGRLTIPEEARAALGELARSAIERRS
jgi:geranylgeranyl diphosphate synthase type I